eukprot:282954-Chlamydomonas_euryale.AAC.1
MSQLEKEGAELREENVMLNQRSSGRGAGTPEEVRVHSCACVNVHASMRKCACANVHASLCTLYMCAYVYVHASMHMQARTPAGCCACVSASALLLRERDNSGVFVSRRGSSGRASAACPCHNFDVC